MVDKKKCSTVLVKFVLIHDLKKMAAQVNFFCFFNVCSYLACNVVPENWHICVNKGITYLLKSYLQALVGRPVCSVQFM